MDRGAWRATQSTGLQRAGHDSSDLALPVVATAAFVVFLKNIFLKKSGNIFKVA